MSHKTHIPTLDFDEINKRYDGTGWFFWQAWLDNFFWDKPSKIIVINQSDLETIGVPEKAVSQYADRYVFIVQSYDTGVWYGFRCKDKSFSHVYFEKIDPECPVNELIIVR